ncbi:MAG: hypothetical protein IPP07_29570 [Holophagales bacterium]|nr:hypothetical protein [Holophagales bacterium]
MARHPSPGVAILGIDIGTFGFLTACPPDAWEPILTDALGNGAAGVPADAERRRRGARPTAPSHPDRQRRRHRQIGPGAHRDDPGRGRRAAGVALSRDGVISPDADRIDGLQTSRRAGRSWRRRCRPSS